MGSLLLGLALVALALHLASCAMVALRLRRPAPLPETRPSGPLPSVTLLRPVCGLDRFDQETLGSSFALHPAPLELVFCAAREEDPAVPLVRRLIAAHPEVPARLLVGDDRASGNPKLDNLLKGWRAARGEWVVMADANLLLPPAYLREIPALRGGDTGMVSSPAVGLWPEGLWGAVECAFLNSNQARLQLVADGLGRGFAQGKTLAFPRAGLEAMGGMAALGRKLAEDAAATVAVRAAGRRVRLTRAPFAQPVGRRSRAQVWDRQLRWSKIRRDGFPGLFLWEPLNGAALPALACALALPALGGGPLWLLAYLGLWWGAEALLARRAGWPLGALGLLALPVRDAMIPALWLATFVDPRFEWRGTAMGPRPSGAAA